MKKYPKIKPENKKLLKLESDVKSLKNLICTILEKIESKSYILEVQQ